MLRSKIFAMIVILCIKGLGWGENIKASWDFSRGPEGWRDEAGSVPKTIQGATLWLGSAQGLSLRSPDLEIPAEASAIVEIRASAEKAGPAHLMWQGMSHSGTATGWQGGLPVPLVPDGQPHVTRVLPYWQNLRTIKALRLVGPPGLHLRLHSLRIIGHNMPPQTQAVWKLNDSRDAGQWLALGGAASLWPKKDGLLIRLNEQELLLASPPLELPTYRFEWLSFEITCSPGLRAWAQWMTTAQPGKTLQELTLRPGRHTYNVRLSRATTWAGTLAGLALLVQGEPPKELTLHHVQLSNAPQGSPDLITKFGGPIEPRIYTEHTFRLVWLLENIGGQQAHQIRVSAEGDDAISLPGSVSVIERLPYGMPEAITWLAKASAPGKIRLRAEYEGKILTEEIEISPQSARNDKEEAWPIMPPSLPPGQPLILAHYHLPPPPGFGPHIWERMLYRRPYLGDYELEPAVMEWHARWALQYGISGFIVDISSNGSPALDAFLSARATRLLKLCLNWTDPVPSVETGWQLIERYATLMRQPNYLTQEDKPILLVSHALQRHAQGWGIVDLQALAAEKSVAFVACLPLSIAAPELLQKAGYAAATDLHTQPEKSASPPILETWEDAATRHVPHILSLQPAWGEGFTAERLHTLLKIALLRASRPQNCAWPWIIVGDWNGTEGLEPRRPEGTIWLEAVSKAAGAPENRPLLLPGDVGQAYFERAYPAPPQAWEFETKESWTSAMGLSVLAIRNGQLTGRTDSPEAAIFGGETMLDTRAYRTILIGLAASAGRQARLWWRTSLRKFTIEHSLPFAIIADGAVHEYRLDMRQAPGWEGYLEGLRLDPTDAADAAIAVDYIRILP